MSKMIAYFVDPNDAWIPIYHQIKQFKKQGMNLEEMAEMKIYLGLDEDTEEPIFLTLVSDDHLLNQKMGQLWRLEYFKVCDKRKLESADEEGFTIDEYVNIFKSMMEVSGNSFIEEEIKDRPVIVDSDMTRDGNIEISKKNLMEFLPSQKMYVIELDKNKLENQIQAVIQEEALKKLFKK